MARPLPELTGTPEQIARATVIRDSFRSLFLTYYKGSPANRDQWRPIFQFILSATPAAFWIANEWRLERASAFYQIYAWHEELHQARGGLAFPETWMG